MKPGLKTSEFWVVAAIVFAIIGISSALFWTGRLEAEQWIALVKWIPGLLGTAYVVARTAAKMTGGGGD